MVTRFHAQLSVAPLKHPDGPRQRITPPMFPRSAERGSIEALGWAGWITSKTRGFHAQLSVAPLKLNSLQRAAFPPVRFHAQLSVAPLKLDLARLIEAKSVCFHAQLSVAPLKRH